MRVCVCDWVHAIIASSVSGRSCVGVFYGTLRMERESLPFCSVSSYLVLSAFSCKLFPAYRDCCITVNLLVGFSSSLWELGRAVRLCYLHHDSVRKWEIFCAEARYRFTVDVYHTVQWQLSPRQLLVHQDALEYSKKPSWKHEISFSTHTQSFHNIHSYVMTTKSSLQLNVNDRKFQPRVKRCFHHCSTK